MHALRTSIVAVLTLATAVAESDLCACAPAVRAGESVHIAEESALIVWDKAARTQHFIRRAQFDTKSGDFGFLVPTPTKPTLSEVDDSIFAHLVQITRPPVAEQIAATRDDVAMAAAAPAPAAGIRVLETATVAGLDAVVLAASDGKALNAWLKDHGYASGPELAEWFKPYIAAKWVFTAFKISKGKSPQASRAITSAVRMSFRTDRPFFPYREPANGNTAPRILEVYFLSDERVQGRIGSKSPDTSTRIADKSGPEGLAWPGRTLWTERLSPSTRDDLLKRVGLPSAAIPGSAWLTRFLDRSAPRPGTDEVYFSRSALQVGEMDANELRKELYRKESAMRSYSIASPNASPNSIAADPGVPLFVQGRDAERRGDIKQAVRLYIRAVRAGDFEAAKALGDIFRTGRGEVSKDHGESLKYYAIAEKNGVKIDKASPR